MPVIYTGQNIFLVVIVSTVISSFTMKCYNKKNTQKSYNNCPFMRTRLPQMLSYTKNWKTLSKQLQECKY